MNTADVQSQVINFLRLFLVVLVLFVHSNFRGVSADWDVFWTTESTGIGPQLPSLGAVIDFISGSLALLANPFFFFISGVLFFREGTFSKELYLQKLLRRSFSLLLPYVLWIFTFLFLLSVAESLLPNWTAIVHKPIENFSFSDWLLCFWDISKIGSQGGIAAPLVIPFWFLRDLMVLCLFTPIIYRVLRGAFFSIKQVKFVDVMRPLKWGGLFFAIFSWQIDSANLMYAGLIVFTVSTATRYLERRKQQNKLGFLLPTFLTDAVFFVFAYHTIVQGGILFLLKRGIIVPHNALEAFTIYLLSPLVMLAIGVALYQLLSKIAPRILSIYCGGR